MTSPTLDLNSTSLVLPHLYGPLVDVRNPFGVIQLGGTVSVGLLGMTTLQTWFYYNNFPDDKSIMKILVAAVWVTEFVRSTFTVHAAYHYLVLNWGNPSALTTNVWSVNVLPLTTILAGALQRSVFIWRIWTLSRARIRWVLTSFVLVLSVCNLSLGLVTYIFSARAVSFVAFADGPQQIISPIALSTAIFTEVVMMASLTFLLNRRRTAFSRTNRFIDTLSFYIVQAGMITVAADIVILTLNHYSNRVGFEYLSVYTILGNLYANSLLASLNARASLRINNTDNSLAMTALGWQSDPSYVDAACIIHAAASSLSDQEERAIHVQITQSIITMKDDGTKHEWPSTFASASIDTDTKLGSPDPAYRISKERSCLPELPAAETSLTTDATL